MTERSTRRSPDTLMTVKRPTLAAVLGISLRQVATLEAAGVILPSRRGKAGRASEYDLVAAVPAYIAHVRGEAAPGAGQADARRRVTAARAALLELRHRRESGQVLDAKAAERAAFLFARTLREQVLGVTARLSAVLAAETDTAAVSRLLDAELRQALSTTADQMQRPDTRPTTEDADDATVR